MRPALFVLVLAAACSKPPVRSPPPAELPADKVADIAGRWAASDDLDWGYSMTIGPGGDIDVWIDRARLGRCEQKGTIAAGASSRAFRIRYTRGECNPEAVGMPIDVSVASFTGASLTIVVGDQHRTYSRAQ